MYMRCLVCLLCFSLFVSCSKKNNDGLTELVAEWYGKEITFPVDVKYTNVIEGKCVNFVGNSEYKILVYVNGDNCLFCKLKMDLWKDFMAYIQEKYHGFIPFLLYINYPNYSEIEYILKSSKFDYPICYDRYDELNKLNKFPLDDHLRTFLLDRDNKVLAIGNPTMNKSIRNLFIKIVTDGDVALESEIQSSIVLSKYQIDLGNMSLGSILTFDILIQNIESKPVRIKQIMPSCNCVKIKHDVIQIEALKSDYFTVEYLADTLGDVFRVIHVYVEGEESPIIITIEGSVY